MIIKKVYECIKELHHKGIYHTDIKPANICFNRHAEYDEYQPKLIDFGATSTNFWTLL